MKDQNGNKITEHEFTKDIGHRTEGALELAKNNSNGLELEEMFEEYAEVKKDFEDCDCQTMESEKACDNCICEAKRMQEIISEVTKQIQSDLLKEVYQRNRNHQPSEDKEKMFRDDLEKLTYICGRVDVVNDIKKLAEEKGIIINK